MTMTTWTESAKTTLEGHLARLQDSLTASGADPVEVADDLRRHIDEEVAARRIGVVTTEDIEGILQRIGMPASPLDHAGRSRREERLERLERLESKPNPASAPAPAPPRAPAESRPEMKWHRWLFFFGVALPATTLVIELLTHMCAAAFFDPIPDLWHVLLVASVPAINLLVWRAVRLRRVASSVWLGAASGFSLGVSAYFAVLYATLAPFALFAVIFLGWGLLPLSPALAFASAWRLRVLAGRIAVADGRCGWRGLGWGLGLAGVVLGLVVLPPVLTRHWSRTVAEGDVEESARALGRLRSYGHERTLLADCYGTTRWALENPFQFHAQGTPVPSEMARVVFYRATGRAFNEFPPPQINYRTRGWDVFGDGEWDGDQGGAAVGGRLRGLSLGQSRLDGLIDGEAGWAYTEWILEFKNVAPREREARAQIVLPPGGVVSRVTLWVNGEEREAAFAGSGEVRAAYEQVVKVYRRDPILVTHSGEDRVLMQCYPVPANGGTIKVRLGITAPLELENEATAVLRWPQFIERNFAVPTGLEHSVWVESEQALATAHPRLAQDHTRPGVHAIRGLVKDDELGRGSSLVRIPRPARARSAWVPDPHAAGQFVRQTLIEGAAVRPDRVVVLVDGSKSMGDVLPMVADALPRLPEGVELSLLVAGDEVEELGGSLRKTDPALLRELSGRLGKVHARGGQDNLRALVRAWDLAGERANSVILWVHGPQPVELETGEILQQRLIWRGPGQGGLTPLIYDLQASPGANRLADRMGRLTTLRAVPRYGSVKEDLDRLFALWRGETRQLGWSRERMSTDVMPEAERGRKSSKHLARLWARDEVLRLIERNKRQDAVGIAAKYQLVTPVSGAVVLETKQQFDQAGLQPVAPDTVPMVPEPGTVALLIVAAALILGGRMAGRLRRSRGARAGV